MSTSNFWHVTLFYSRNNSNNVFLEHSILLKLRINELLWINLTRFLKIYLKQILKCVFVTVTSSRNPITFQKEDKTSANWKLLKGTLQDLKKNLNLNMNLSESSTALLFILFNYFEEGKSLLFKTAGGLDVR